ncbi:PD-(D/E)XK nuclease family protein [Holdemanella sp. SCCA2]|nr:PD-(D/E)XK nuclease family protein [Holdemanella sp. SCCA2]
MEEFNNKIVILNDYAKKSFIKKIDKLINVKVITLSELKRKYYFDYDNKAIYFVSNKYNCIPEIANIYIENIYYLKDIDNEKINFLKDIKNDLETNNLLTYNNLFKEFLKGKEIVLYNLKYTDKFYKNIFKELEKFSKITIYNDEDNSIVKELYKANNSEEEIAFVCSKITKLIKSGVNINNIKLANVKSDYEFIIRKTFKLFNIPINLPSFETIKSTSLVIKFKELYNSDINETIEKLKEFINTKEENDIYKNIISIVNNYLWSNDFLLVKDMVFNDIDNIKTPREKLKNAVEVIEFKKELVTDEDYVFLIGYNEGVIPVNYKDEDYLSDSIKEKLGLSTSFELNENAMNETKDNIRNIKNLIVTYPSHNLSSEIYISSSYEKDLFEEKELNISFNESNTYNKLKLVSEKDENSKFGTITDNLLKLSSHYKDMKYNSYDNKYKMIDKTKIKEFFKDGLTLSYTSINDYYMCSFRYYLNYILKVNKFEDTFEATVGSIFHKILSMCFDHDIDIIRTYETEIENSNYEFNESEKFFLSILKDELVLIIETIKNQLSYTQLTNSMYEKKIVIDVDKDLQIRFKGFVDKILYNEFNGKTVVAIIDYKTGNPNLNINNTIYGLEMQLPVYIYLIKNEIKDVKIGGFYLQKILNNTTDKEKRLDSLKLQGYTNSDLEYIDKVDSSFNDSKVIKSLRTSSKGFYYYSKMINDEEIDTLYNVVDSKIKEASMSILDSKFDINPKEMNNENIGCSFCKYKDICFMKPKDTIKLKEVKNIFEEVE